MNCLVTGASGFIGGHLVEFLVAEGHKVTGLGRIRPPQLATLGSNFTFAEVDLIDRGKLGSLIDTASPELVFHLAAQSYPGESWKQPIQTFEVNVLGTIFLFEEILARKLNPTIVVTCSSSEYAPVGENRPIRERDELVPSSPYAVSKLAQDHLGRLYHEFYGLRVIRCRPFFLIGPRKTGDVASDFARGIVAIERGLEHHLRVGNLDVVRDLLDVRDGVEAIWLLSQRGCAGDVYNICSGNGYSLRDVLSMYKSLTAVDVKEQLVPSRIRRIDEKVKIGDPTKLQALGWLPRRSIQQVLKDILDYWRDHRPALLPEE